MTYSKKNLFLAYNFIIAIAYLLLMIFSMIGLLLTNDTPSELKTATGTVARFKQFDADELDEILGNHSFFNVTFTDGMFFEAQGICYDNIDDNLFSRLSVGDTITVMYKDKGCGKAKQIYGIEYYGNTYLDTENTLSEGTEDNSSLRIVFWILIPVATVTAGILFILNYVKNKRKPPENINMQ